ncbi:hypothetical protein Tco_0526721 [Tanacetum coccineum]
MEILPKSTLNSSAETKTWKPKRKDTEIPQSSVPSDNVADEAVNEKMDDSLEKGCHYCYWLRCREITSLKLRVKKLEKKGGSRTHKLKRLYKVGRSARIVSSDEASLGDQEDASKQGRKIDDIDKDAEITLVDETQGSKKDDVVSTAVVAAQVSIDATTVTITPKEITLAQALQDLKAAKPKVKGIVFKEPVEIEREKAEANIALKETWDDIQAKMEADCLLAERLQIREQEELTIEERAKFFQQLLEKRRKHFAAKKAEEKRNRPPTRAQQRSIMCTYLKNMEGWKPKDLKLVEGSSKRAGTELEQEVIKNQKVDDVQETAKVDEDKETAELQSLMEVIPDEEEVAVDAIPLATKPLSIVD